MGKLADSTWCSLVTVLLVSAVAAPTVPAADPKPPAPAASPAAPAAPTDSKDPGPLPSRYAGADLSTYVAAIADHFSIRSRTTDPFCQSQDPNAKVIIKTTTPKQVRRAIPTAEPPTPLSAIVEQIEITTVMPKDRRFLVGERSFGQGDSLTLNFRNKPIRTRITEVSSSRIVFTNADTGEVGIRLLDLLPAGMTPGTREIIAPGMVPLNSDAPLDVGTPLPSGTPPP